MRVALKCEASLLMLMDVVAPADTSELPAGLPATAAATRGVRGVWQPAVLNGDMPCGPVVRRGALGLVGSAPWCVSVARGEQGAGLQGGVLRGWRGSPNSHRLLCVAYTSRCLCDSRRPCTEALYDSGKQLKVSSCSSRQQAAVTHMQNKQVCVCVGGGNSALQA